MTVVKYWKVDLFRDNDRRSSIAGMMSPAPPFFTGYSHEKPGINLQSDVQPTEYIELYTAPDAFDSRMFRRHSFDYVHLTPIYESGEKCCDDDEQAKASADKYHLSTSFEEAARPMIKWLAENVNPHHKVVVTCIDAELLSSENSYSTEAFLKD